MSDVITPHGGELVDRFVSGDAAAALTARAAALPRIVLDAREQADLELIATGAASPIRGFLGSKDYERVVSDLRLADGTVWPLPLTLAVDHDAECRARRGSGALRRERAAVGRHRRRGDLRARPGGRVRGGLRHVRPEPSRRRLSAPAPAHAGRRRGHRPPAARRPAVRAVPVHAARAAPADRRARLEPRRRLPDPQPDPPRARAPDEDRAGVRRRPGAPSAGRRDEAGRRAGGDAVQGL